MLQQLILLEIKYLQWLKYVQPKKIYTHAKTGDIVNIRLDQDRKHIKSGTYTGRVKTPTAKGVEVKIDGYRISSNQFSFVHQNDGYYYSFNAISVELLNILFDSNLMLSNHKTNTNYQKLCYT